MFYVYFLLGDDDGPTLPHLLALLSTLLIPTRSSPFFGHVSNISEVDLRVEIAASPSLFSFIFRPIAFFLFLFFFLDHRYLKGKWRILGPVGGRRLTRLTGSNRIFCMWVPSFLFHHRSCRDKKQKRQVQASDGFLRICLRQELMMRGLKSGGLLPVNRVLLFFNDWWRT